MSRYWKKDYISKNGLTPNTNRFIGSLTYFIFHSIIFIISFKIWGIQMFNEFWFYIMNLIAFMSVKIFLRITGIWVY